MPLWCRSWMSLSNFCVSIYYFLDFLVRYLSKTKFCGISKKMGNKWMKRIKSMGKDIFYFCKEEKRVNRSSTMWIRKRPENSCQPYFEQYNNQDMSSIVHVLFEISPSFTTHNQPYQMKFLWKNCSVLSDQWSIYLHMQKSSNQAQCFQRQSNYCCKGSKQTFEKE